MTLNQIFYFIKAAELENSGPLRCSCTFPSLPSAAPWPCSRRAWRGIVRKDRTRDPADQGRKNILRPRRKDQYRLRSGDRSDGRSSWRSGKNRYRVCFFLLAGHYIPSKVRLFLEKKENENVSFSFLQDHSHDIGFGGKTDDPDLEFYPLIGYDPASWMGVHTRAFYETYDLQRSK